MKKCKGCGAILQTNNQSDVGYVNNLEQDYCKRCFRLTHYGDISNFKTSYVNNEHIINIYKKYQNSIFVVIIDILDSFVLEDDDLLDIFSNYQTVLVINKTDILPSNINYSKIEKIITNKLFNLNKKYKNIKAAILTNKYENKFNEQFINLLDDLKTNTVVFAGRANAGKSSLINKLLNSNSLTSSIYPGTTLDEIEINYKDYIFVDTPGLVDINNYSTHLNLEKYKLSKIDKTIKPQIFQLFEKQTYFYEGLFRVDIDPKNECSVSFYINNNNEIHRCKYENGDDYYQNHYHDFTLKVKPLMINRYNINEYKLFVIKGLGLIKINGKCSINIHSLKDLKVYESEISI